MSAVNRLRTRCTVLTMAIALSMLGLVLVNNAVFVHPGGQRRSIHDIRPDPSVVKSHEALPLHPVSSGGAETWASRAVSMGVAIGFMFAIVNLIPQRADAILGLATFHHDDSAAEVEPRIWKRGERAKELWRNEGGDDPTATMIGAVLMFTLSLVAGMRGNDQPSDVSRVLDTTEDPERLQFESDHGGMFKSKRKGAREPLR